MKMGFGDGLVVLLGKFDDFGWWIFDLLYDWVVEVFFLVNVLYSYGYWVVGLCFLDVNVGWYWKMIMILKEDLGCWISLVFDGVFWVLCVWINGFYFGEELSGYLGFCYDVLDYFNYGGENVIVVCVDVMMEEGWFYEGVGIYWYVWLEKMVLLYLVVDGMMIMINVDEIGVVMVEVWLEVVYVFGKVELVEVLVCY